MTQKKLVLLVFRLIKKRFDGGNDYVKIEVGVDVKDLMNC